MTKSLIGNNNPPSAIDLAQEAFSEVGKFLELTPVVQNETHAKAAKRMVDRANAALKEMEDERDKKVRPLNEQVKEINGTYRSARGPLEKLLVESKGRLQLFIEAEEKERLRALAEAQQRREEAERAAREAEAKEQAAKEEAKLGVETDVAAATTEADATFSRFQVEDRATALAAKETKVKISDGFNRALTIKTYEVLVVEDWNKAITNMGLTDKIREAILSSARAYRETFEELPEGIATTYERRI